MILALVIAGVHSGRISSLLPNYSMAILSARRVFHLLDTRAGIDSYSTKGLKPVSGGIQGYCIYLVQNLPMQYMNVGLNAVVSIYK